MFNLEHNLGYLFSSFPKTCVAWGLLCFKWGSAQKGYLFLLRLPVPKPCVIFPLFLHCMYSTNICIHTEEEMWYLTFFVQYNAAKYLIRRFSCRYGVCDYWFILLRISRIVHCIRYGFVFSFHEEKAPSFCTHWGLATCLKDWLLFMYFICAYSLWKCRNNFYDLLLDILCIGMEWMI